MTLTLALRPIILDQKPGSSFAENPSVPASQASHSASSARLLWSANRNNPVPDEATLNFTAKEGLVLKDANGTLVWSTNTTGKSVAGINLTETGNLVLFDGKNRTVWQSFDHPTDTLLVGQRLISGQNLTATISSDEKWSAMFLLTNWTDEGLYSLSVTDKGLYSIVRTEPPQYYFEYTYNAVYPPSLSAQKESTKPNYVILSNGSFSLFVPSVDRNHSIWGIRVPQARSVQYVKLDYDGHLKVYDWVESQWQAVADLLTQSIGECGYPLVCGRYGICSSHGNGASVNCSCPKVATSKRNYFILNDSNTYPNPGCYEVTPLSCTASKYHELIEQKNVTFSNFGASGADINNTDMESCKKACLSNCSCRAALFYSSGECYLPSQIISLKDSGEGPSLFLKVQVNLTVLPPTAEPRTPVPPRRGRKTIRRSVIILVSSLGAFFGLCVIIFICVFLSRKKRGIDEIEEDDLDQMPGMPMRFTYEELKVTTENFRTKLGQGGYGSVFEGTLSNGTKVAVKHLDGVGHVKKSFLAEVNTIGSIHHLNLVRLVGYCAEKSHRLLVYEYMCNGSLEKWIFNSNQEVPLTWKNRRKIILDIAKGLAYLHEDCQHKIVHLDIKPQNILLDANFNAKVSDFGLSKLIDRDQTEVVTTMKGTPGYMAPEWLSSIITEKVDVYSFGVMVLEIICGRKNLDRSQPEEDMHLLALFRRRAEEDQLLNMVDKSEDMQLHRAEIVEILLLAAWCLQSDFTKRPSMSMVVKAMEGLMEIERNLDHNFWIPPVQRTMEVGGHEESDVGASTPMLASALSGPR
ncbi:G-type lectin S-receptor-like serine/threonine-protein kinase SD2-5 isoform X2 [Actinidia eriantha]|uniref:G-type lectin S-receptor-like serine/threonine-protein kinase SD2-5 isoform X2 n=1 Tax=Actinidia eriantha TaxID=165200 RepID=UPI0025855EA6|nr:G-type lectin S-receptor-like serine/threonine-protein kinase SD2-5 isoform X2 [Actinidia eriantha]